MYKSKDYRRAAQPAGSYMFKGNTRNTRTRFEIF